MSNIPHELRYSKTHEWIRREDDGSVTIGITDHAQGLLGEVVFVELPEVETQLKEGDDCGVVESVKAASDLYAPVSGEITEVNNQLEDSPDQVNHDPYNDGWILKVQLADEGEWDDLLDADAYEELIEAEGH